MTDPAQYWKPAEDVTLRRLHKQGLSLNECAKRMKRSPSTISTHGDLLKLPWDRSHMKAATDANVADNKARRSALESRFLSEAEGILGQLHDPMTVYAFTKEGFDFSTLPTPNPAGVRDLMTAASIAVSHSLKIAVHDSDSSHDDAKSMLTSLAAAMGMAFREGEAVL
jgi:hypothetical protein